MLDKKNLQLIQYSYRLGIDEKSTAAYTKPQIGYANIIKTVDKQQSMMAGVLPDSDIIIEIEIGNITNYIDEFTVFWVNNIPNSVNNNFDFIVSKMGGIYNNILTIYCKSNTPNHQSLFYSPNDLNVYEVKLSFDFGVMTATIPINMYLPLSEDTKIWYTKPINTSSTTNLIKFIDKQLVSPLAYKLTFEKV